MQIILRCLGVDLIADSIARIDPEVWSDLLDPESALSDGFQALTPSTYRQMMAECRKVAAAIGRDM